MGDVVVIEYCKLRKEELACIRWLGVALVERSKSICKLIALE